MFGKPTQFCLDARQCFCNTYGYCNMTDEDLKKQWEWRGLTLPEGWPNVPEAPTDEIAEAEREEEEEEEESPETESTDSNSESKESTEQSTAQGNSTRLQRRRLADQVPDISDASRRALRERSI